jgi:Fe-S-cluster-containing dehydrogenase component
MIQVYESLCSGCGACVSACPQLAVFLVRGQVQIDFQRCDGCKDVPETQVKLCVEACPNHALQWVEEKRNKDDIIAVTKDQKLVPVEWTKTEEYQPLEQRRSEIMPRIGNVLKQVGEELIKELPAILPNLVVSSCRRDGEGRKCSSPGRQKHLRRRRHQRG